MTIDSTQALVIALDNQPQHQELIAPCSEGWKLKNQTPAGILGGFLLFFFFLHFEIKPFLTLAYFYFINDFVSIQSSGFHCNIFRHINPSLFLFASPHSSPSCLLPVSCWDSSPSAGNHGVGLVKLP